MCFYWIEAVMPQHCDMEASVSILSNQFPSWMNSIKSVLGWSLKYLAHCIFDQFCMMMLACQSLKLDLKNNIYQFEIKDYHFITYRIPPLPCKSFISCFHELQYEWMLRAEYHVSIGHPVSGHPHHIVQVAGGGHCHCVQVRVVASISNI